MVKEFEGCYLEAYQDVVGVWTIGYGITSSDKAITGKTIKKGMKISQETAERWLEESLNKKYLPLVLKYQTTYGFNTSQIDALVSFAYNIGSIDGLTDKGKRSIRTIEDKILLYNKAGGKELRGLTRRRLRELEMFRGGSKRFDEGFHVLPSRGYFQLADKGKQVGQVQKLLTWMDFYNGKIDNIYGLETVKAVKKLQDLIGTSQNGKFGSKCLPFCKKYKK
jgi:GH24 family phage-related lysozyme (muramidase)